MSETCAILSYNANLRPKKTYKRSTRPKRLNRVKEITKRLQTSNEKIEDDFTEFAKTRKDRTSNPPEVPKPDGEPNITSSRMNAKNNGAPKSDDPEKNVGVYRSNQNQVPTGNQEV